MRPTAQERPVIGKGVLVPKQRGTPPPMQGHQAGQEAGEWGQEPPVWLPREETGEAGYVDLGSIGLGGQGRPDRVTPGSGAVRTGGSPGE